MVCGELDDDDAPALQVVHQLTVAVPSELKQRDLKPGRHGPVQRQNNPIISSMYESEAHRVYCGLQLGDIVFWQLRVGSEDGVQTVQGHASARHVGKHSVRVHSINRVRLLEFVPAGAPVYS